MNTYRVKVRRNDLSPRVFSWDVNAASPSKAIVHALKGIAAGSDVDISVRLYAKDIEPDARSGVLRAVG